MSANVRALKEAIEAAVEVEKGEGGVTKDGEGEAKEGGLVLDEDF